MADEILPLLRMKQTAKALDQMLRANPACDVNACGCYTQRPMVHVAAAARRYEHLKVLLAHGADVDKCGAEALAELERFPKADGAPTTIKTLRTYMFSSPSTRMALRVIWGYEGEIPEAVLADLSQRSVSSAFISASEKDILMQKLFGRLAAASKKRPRDDDDKDDVVFSHVTTLDERNAIGFASAIELDDA